MTWHMLSASPSGVQHITHYQYHTQHSAHNATHNTHNYIQHIVLHSIQFDSILFITTTHTLALPSEPSIIDITVEIHSHQRGNKVFYEQWKWNKSDNDISNAKYPEEQSRGSSLCALLVCVYGQCGYTRSLILNQSIIRSVDRSISRSISQPINQSAGQECAISITEWWVNDALVEEKKLLFETCREK